MNPAEIDRLWRLVGEVDPKGVDLELGMLEQWAQETTEAHGGVPVQHLAPGLPWAARRLNWQLHTGPNPPLAAAEPEGLPRRAPWLHPEAEAPKEATPAPAAAPHGPGRRGVAQGWPQDAAAVAPERPRIQGLHPEELRPAPRPPEGHQGQILSLAQRQRAARKRGQESLAQAMAARPEPKGQPPLWADEAGEVLPEWAQVIGMHEHPVARARRLASPSPGAAQAWRPEPGTQPQGWGPLPGARPHGGPSELGPWAFVGPEEAKAKAWAGGATVAELLAQGPEAWPEPDEGPRGLSQGALGLAGPGSAAWGGLEVGPSLIFSLAALLAFAFLVLVP